MTEREEKLLEQMEMALDAFVVAFADHSFFRGSPIAHAAIDIRAMRTEMRERAEYERLKEKFEADES